MRNTAAARRYARALFGLSQEAGSTPAIRQALADMAELFTAEPALRNALFRPLHPAKERRAVVSSVCDRLQLDVLVRNFLVYLIDQRRLVDFAGIRDAFDQLADDAAGLVKAQVTTAAPLADAQRERLRSALAAKSGRRVELDLQVDPELIGGAVAVVGNVVYDGSLRTQLSQLRDTLTRG